MNAEKQQNFYDNRFSDLNRALNKLTNEPFIFYDTRLFEIMFNNICNFKVWNMCLDVGTGQGTDTILLSKKGNYVVGVEISSQALKIAKYLSRKKKVEAGLSFILSDATYLPFREKIFDVTYCKDVLHHVSDSLQVVMEMKRVSKDDGDIVAIEANALNPQMIIIGILYYSIDKGIFKNSSRRLCNTFIKAGLSNINVVETEFLPRHILFEFRSPFSRFKTSSLLSIICKIESAWQKRKSIRKLSNYLIISGIKNRKDFQYE